MVRAQGTYARFATYYDFIYETMVDYDADVRYLENVFRSFLGKRPRSIVDPPCGTGNHALRLARRGHEAVGVDPSREQPAVACWKANKTRPPVRILHAATR